MPERGNKPKDYRNLAQENRTEQEQVAAWRARITRHANALRLKDRAARSDALRVYLGRQSDGKDRVHLPYLKAILVDMHLRTLPAIPSATCESRTAAGEAYEEQTRAMVDYIFAKRNCRIAKTATALQWDDDFSGIGIGKIQWVIDYSEADEPRTLEDGAIESEMERAAAENMDPSRASISESDVDSVHIKVHEEELRAREGAGLVTDPDTWTIYEHLQEHRNRHTVIKREFGRLSRVPPFNMVYDTDVPWEERTFEAELRSIKIADMLKWGYRNVNMTNCPPEARTGQGELIFEEMTARVWEIHDLENDKFIVISCDGPRDGLFLHRSRWPYGDVEVYLPLVFNSIGDDQLHGIPVAELLVGILDELARVDFHIRRHAREHADYKLGGPSTANDQGIKAGLSDPNRKYVFEGSPEAWQLMKEIKPPPIPETLLEYRTLLMDSMRRVTATDAQNVAQSFDHQISATESANRQETHELHRGERQEIMSEFLGRVAENMLKMYRSVATQGMAVRIADASEENYRVINPTELPEAIDVIFDIRGESDSGRAEQISAANAYKDFLIQIGQNSPTDWEKFRDWYGRRLGVKRPDRFHAPVQTAIPGQAPTEEPGSPAVQTTPLQFPKGGFAEQGIQ